MVSIHSPRPIRNRKTSNYHGYSNSRNLLHDRPPLPEAREREAKQLEAQARSMLSQAGKNTDIENMLLGLKKYSGLLGEYSPYNAALIYWQNHDATIVHSRKDWERLGYNIREDGKSMQVLVPIGAVRKVSKPELAKFIEDKRKEGLSDEAITLLAADKFEKRKGFRRVHTFTAGGVYDAGSVTGGEGKPIEQAEKIRLSKLYTDFKKTAGQHWRVEEGVVSDARGFTTLEKSLEEGKPAQMMIRVMKVPNEDVEPLHTLAHEMAHARLKHIEERKRPRKIQEAEAELAAYLALSHYGVDTSHDSAAYIGGWLKKEPMGEEAVDRAMNAARWIIANTDAQIS